MLEPRRDLHTAMAVAVPQRMQTAARLAAVRRRLAACVVVSIVLGYALSQVLTAWYRNGPLGLEQGFTIRRIPTGGAHAPLTLSLALAGGAHGSLRSRGQSLTLSLAGGSSLRYGGLRVSDARGRPLHSWLELRAGALLVHADTRGARYPLRVDPFIQQGEKLTGTGQSGPVTPRQGYGVALSSNGNTALVGGPGDYGETGAAWIFTRSG